MKRVLLVCGAGMSTSLLVKKMQEVDVKHEYYIQCSDTVSAKIQLVDYDIFLLAPHISFMKDEFMLICKQFQLPFMVIDSLDYTKMDGKEVLKKVETILLAHDQENPFKVVLLHGRGGAMSDLIAMDMKKKRSDREKDWVIESVIIDEFQDNGKTNIVLLEPHLTFEMKNIKQRFKNPFLIVEVPSRALYATFDGRKVLDYIHQIYNVNLQRKKDKMKKGIQNI